MCYICGSPSHIAGKCEHRKFGPSIGTGAALVTSGEYDLSDSDVTEWNSAMVVEGREHLGCVMGEVQCHMAMFTKYEVLLDNEASLSVFSNTDLLTNIRASRRSITMKGVQSDAAGVKIRQEGDFGDVGVVYVSDRSNANILSFASQVDNGADISYDKVGDLFTMRPAGSNKTYSFARKDVSGSEGRFYSCDVRSMISRDQDTEHAMVQTVAGNLQHYTKREVQGAVESTRVRAQLGYPSLQQAISIDIIIM